MKHVAAAAMWSPGAVHPAQSIGEGSAGGATSAMWWAIAVGAFAVEG